MQSISEMLAELLKPAGTVALPPFHLFLRQPSSTTRYVSWNNLGCPGVVHNRVGVRSTALPFHRNLSCIRPHSASWTPSMFKRSSISTIFFPSLSLDYPDLSLRHSLMRWRVPRSGQGTKRPGLFACCGPGEPLAQSSYIGRVSPCSDCLFSVPLLGLRTPVLEHQRFP